MSHDPLKHDGEVKTEMDCTHCSKLFVALVDYSLNGNHSIECPFCGHEHQRVVRGGRITGERWGSTSGDKRDIHKPRNVWKADSLVRMETSSASEFMRQRWIDKLR